MMARNRIEQQGGLAGRSAMLLALLGLGACASNAITVPTDSLTVQRVMGQPAEAPPLLPTPGNVWPAAEAERATMANTDLLTRPMDPNAPPPPRAGRRGSSTPPDLLQPGTDPAPVSPGFSATPPPAENAPPPRRRAEGQVIPTPNGPAVTTGGGAGYRTYNAPGGGSGIATPENGSTTLLGTDGTVRQVPTPR
jgi:hypothetical protein